LDKIAIIGLGYVGLPLAVEFGKKFETIGIDINESRIEELKRGYDRTLEVDAHNLKNAKKLTYTTNFDDIKDCNIFIVTVPTPINSANRPDLTPIKKSTESIAKILKKDDIVIYESTVYPGVTEEICVPILEEGSGFKYNKDFYCGYSPERINPGDKERTLTKILKITSGSTPKIAKKVDDLYNTIITAGTHLAPSIKVAEAAKVIENTQRDVNIALMNELAMIFDAVGIDTKAVLEAAGTKWNFIKLTPGLVGGHCIGVDPYYLTHKAEEMGYKPDLILSSRKINNSMGKFISDKTIKLMIEAEKKIKDANVLILGLTFKENCPDMRNTKVVDIIEELEDFGCKVDVYDPWVDPKEPKKYYKHSQLDYNPFEADKKYDAIVLAVAHDQFVKLTKDDFEKISDGQLVLIDVKNVSDDASWRL
jgi:UDP-N-acetyl-D-galactosamine dehydrogenase